MAKIMGNIVGLPSPRSDWNQTDETKADYIKNKPLELLSKLQTDKADAPTVLTPENTTSFAIPMVDNTIFSFGVISSSVKAAYANMTIGYTSALYFSTPDEMPEDYSNFPEEVIFKGDSTEDGRFVPEANTRYTMVFDYDGQNVIGYVSGVAI